MKIERALGDRLLELMTDDTTGECNTVDPEIAKIAFEIIESEDVPDDPALFPFEDGGVQLVWRINGRRITVAVSDVDSISARVFCPLDRSASREWEWSDMEEVRLKIGEIFNI